MAQANQFPLDIPVQIRASALFSSGIFVLGFEFMLRNLFDISGTRSLTLTKVNEN
jgi:hypothetical protein